MFILEVFTKAMQYRSLEYIIRLHILSPESCNGILTYEKCKPIRALTDAVQKVNSMSDVDGNCHLQKSVVYDRMLPKGVFVTGDLTASALYEEFFKCREILDQLIVPWWPLLGNHDRSIIHLLHGFLQFPLAYLQLAIFQARRLHL